MKKRRIERKNKHSLKWGNLLMAFAMVLSTIVGLWSVKPTKALGGDPGDWTVTDESGLTFTVTTIEQDGIELVPQTSPYIYNYATGEFGNIYFSTTNSADKIRVGVRVNGMQEGNTYRIFNERTITSEDNDTEIFEEIVPEIYNYQMQDSTEPWMDQEFVNEYVIHIFMYNEDDYNERVQKDIIVRPENVGSRNIEIVSVKQNGVDVFYDRVGRQVTSYDDLVSTLQTINEFRLDDYITPIEVTYTFKNLEVNHYYSFEAGGEYDSFKADASEKTFTSVLNLNLTEKHASSSIGLYGNGDYDEGNNVKLYFRIANPNFIPLGDIIIDEVSQAGSPADMEEDANGSPRYYTFNVNDVQPVNVRLHADSATDNINYLVSYSGYGGNVYLRSDEPLEATGAELKSGVTLTIPSGYGLSEDSPIQMQFHANTIENMHYGSQYIIYGERGEYQYSSDYILFNYYEDAELPRYGARIGYRDSDEEIYDVINAKYHSEGHPLWIRVEGERYNDEQTYEIHGRINTEEGEYYSETFTATGAELNEGKTFVLDGLVLDLPVFDPDSDTSGYEISYEFSLEIDGLEQRGSMIYMYDGWIYTLMTYAGGKVAANGSGGGGMGGTMFLSSSMTTVRRSSIDGSGSAVLNYLGGGFDEELEFDYALYYNDNAGENWWSAPAGTKVDEGTISGETLNHDGFTVQIAVPDQASESSMYTLVITRNGGLVIASKDFLRFTDDPMIESFLFHANSDSFMQTGREGYRLARGADMTATLKGVGFEDEQEYRIWVSYNGHGYFDDEWGGHWDDIDLEQLNSDVVVTGAQLNAGYSIELLYDEAIDEAEDVEIIFNIADRDHDKPDFYNTNEEGVYGGHAIYIEYVAEEDVFHGGGFQIDEETGEIVDVSQPDEPGEFVDNRTNGQAEVTVEGGMLTLTAEKACLVIGVRGDDYTIVEAGMGEINDGVTTNVYDVSEFDGVGVVLKGDGDLDGEVSTADSNLINRSLISPSLRPYRPLSDVERVLLDVDGDGEISTADSNLINRSLISPSLRPYLPIQW